MGSFDIKIDLKGDEELREKLTNPALLAGPLRELLGEAAAIGQKRAVHGIDGGTGVAVRSILTEVRSTSASVWTAIATQRAKNIEEGRAPGDNKFLSDGGVKKWAKAVGINTGEEGSRYERNVIWVLIQGIRQRGVKGRFFMQAAREKIQSELPRLLKEMGEKIGEKFGR